MRSGESIGLEQFLTDYPQMAIRPSAGVHLRLKGVFKFIATQEKYGEVTDQFRLQIDIPAAFPREIPEVTELDGRIPRQGSYHVNGNGTFCLGSHLRLLLKLNANPTLGGFANDCLVPYLYAISHKLTNGGKLIFGELEHYGPGMLEEYVQLFGVPSAVHAKYTLMLLAMKKRMANKRQCPCGCYSRLGRCRVNLRILPFRKLASRRWFRKEVILANQTGIETRKVAYQKAIDDFISSTRIRRGWNNRVIRS